MIVTMCLKGPMMASKRLSPLTAKALGLERASWHTTLAAGITGAGGQPGGKGAARAGRKPAHKCRNQPRGLSIRAPKHPGPRSARIQLGFPWAT